MMNSAIIIFSNDKLFISYVNFHYREENIDTVIDRVVDTEELVILLDACVQEEINSIKLICDNKLSINELTEIEEIMDSYANQMEFEFKKGIEEYYEFQDL